MTPADDLTMVMQSLDNRSANPMAVPGWVAAPDVDEGSRRQEAMRLINEVTLDAPCRLSAAGRAKAFRGPWSFVLEVVPEDLDVAGRRSPVVCQGLLGKVRPTFEEALEVVSEISAFCARQGRAPFPPALQHEAAQLLLETLRGRSAAAGDGSASRVLRALRLR